MTMIRGASTREPGYRAVRTYGAGWRNRWRVCWFSTLDPTVDRVVIEFDPPHWWSRRLAQRHAEDLQRAAERVR
jgi:hypothetical protein